MPQRQLLCTRSICYAAQVGRMTFGGKAYRAWDMPNGDAHGKYIPPHGATAGGLAAACSQAESIMDWTVNKKTIDRLYAEVDCCRTAPPLAAWQWPAVRQTIK